MLHHRRINATGGPAFIPFLGGTYVCTEKKWWISTVTCQEPQPPEVYNFFSYLVRLLLLALIPACMHSCTPSKPYGLRALLRQAATRESKKKANQSAERSSVIRRATRRAGAHAHAHAGPGFVLGGQADLYML